MQSGLRRGEGHCSKRRGWHLSCPVFMPKGLLVASSNALREIGGGVQRCNVEYISCLEAADFELIQVPFEYDLDLVSKIRRRVNPSASQVDQPRNLYGMISEAIRKHSPSHVFFSLTMFSKLSRRLRQDYPGVLQVFLSHGVEGLDYCIEERLQGLRRGSGGRARWLAERTLGREFFETSEQRRWIDAVITLAPLEYEVERWLGSNEVLCLQRSLFETPLTHAPVDGRVGCVSTLNHPPNLHGLLELLGCLDRERPSDLRLRLVGGPASYSSEISQRFPFVDCLGSLSDSELRMEAASWCCFVHPMFVYAKGSSMKLASALGWGLPIATTQYGSRGYAWNEESTPLAKSPADLAALVIELSSVADFCRHAEGTRGIAALAPTAKEAGEALRRFLAAERLGRDRAAQ